MKQLADFPNLQALIDNLSVVDDIFGATAQVSASDNIVQGVKLDKGQTHLQLAKVYFHKNAFGKAIAHSQYCEAIAQKSTNNNLLYDARLVEVESLLRIGRFTDAKILLLKTQDIKGKIDPDSLMCWLELMAMCERRLGQNLAAAEYLSLGLKHASDVLSEYWMASFCRDMSYLEMIQGNYHKAELFAQQAVDSSEKTTDELLMESCIGTIGNLYFRMGLVDKALGCQLKALRYSERIGTPDLLGGTYVNLGNVYYAQGDFNQASKCLRKAIAHLKETENKKFYFNALNNYSHNE
ncbi:MAG: tetratricopeptide (TPR) repeat protein, partial [Limisphaerales bacterium]